MVHEDYMSYALRSNHLAVLHSNVMPNKSNKTGKKIDNAAAIVTEEPSSSQAVVVTDIPKQQAMDHISANDGLTAILNEMKTQFERVNTKLSSIETDVRRLETIENDLKNQDKRITDVETTADSNASRVEELEKKYIKLQNENKRSNALRELHDRRLNALFHGFPEQPSEDRNASKTLIEAFFNEALKIPNSERITIVDCHRLPLNKGTYTGTKIRPIIVRFLTVQDKKTVFEKATANLKQYNTANEQTCYITGHLPRSMQLQRKRLQKLHKKARAEKIHTQWIIDFDKGECCLKIGDNTHYASDTDE